MFVAARTRRGAIVLCSGNNEANVTGKKGASQECFQDPRRLDSVRILRLQLEGGGKTGFSDRGNELFFERDRATAGTIKFNGRGTTGKILDCQSERSIITFAEWDENALNNVASR